MAGKLRTQLHNITLRVIIIFRSLLPSPAGRESRDPLGQAGAASTLLPDDFVGDHGVVTLQPEGGHFQLGFAGRAQPVKTHGTGHFHRESLVVFIESRPGFLGIFTHDRGRGKQRESRFLGSLGDRDGGCLGRLGAVRIRPD